MDGHRKYLPKLKMIQQVGEVSGELIERVSEHSACIFRWKWQPQVDYNTHVTHLPEMKKCLSAWKPQRADVEEKE